MGRNKTFDKPRVFFTNDDFLIDNLSRPGVGNIDAAKGAVESGAVASKRQVGLGHLLDLFIKANSDLQAA